MLLQMKGHRSFRAAFSTWMGDGSIFPDGYGTPGTEHLIEADNYITRRVSREGRHPTRIWAETAPRPSAPLVIKPNRNGANNTSEAVYLHEQNAGGAFEAVFTR